MPVSLVIVDDFLSNPDAFRTQALGLTYTQPGAYPGFNSVEQLNIDGLDQVVSQIVNEPLRAIVPPESHGKCRLTLAEQSKPGLIHVDQSDWSGILYLSRPEDCQGGTGFYRHIPTGTDRVPTTIEGLNDLGFSSYDEFRRATANRDSADRSTWDMVMNVPMRFNRLVLLQPWFWHTSGPGFGDSIENGRLIFVMFFRRVQQ